MVDVGKGGKGKASQPLQDTTAQEDDGEDMKPSGEKKQRPM
jgi:hypothetical protein